MRKIHLLFKTLGALGFLLVDSAQADIQWSSAQNITGEADFSDRGQLLEAVRWRDGGQNLGPTTVAGQAWQGMGSAAKTESYSPKLYFRMGDETTSDGFGGYAAGSGGEIGKWGALSAGMKDLLAQGIWSGADFTLTLTDLVPGARYEVQIFANDSRDGASGRNTVLRSGGSQVTLRLNVGDTGSDHGNLGQFVTGTFTAMDATERITVSGRNRQINAMQLRRLAGSARTQPEHPSLLVTKGDFVELRGRQNQEPWKRMARIAQTYPDSDRQSVFHGQRDFGRCALAYVLATTEEEKRRLRDIVVKRIADWKVLVGELSLSSHGTYVFSANSVMNSMVALDMVWDDLSREERVKSLATVTDVIRWYRDNPSPWKLCDYGLAVTYALMLNTPDVDARVKQYKNYLLETSGQPDGTWTQSPGYFSARVTGTRYSKTFPIDFITKAGKHDFYNDRQFQRMLEWFASYAVTPRGRIAKFGDYLGHRRDDNVGASVDPFYTRMDLYGARLGRLGRWVKTRGGNSVEITKYDGDIFHQFVLHKPSHPKTIEAPKSSLWRNSGAAFRAQPNDAEGFYSALYSLREKPGHKFGHLHSDVNSIQLIGYGENLIMDSGVRYFPRYPGQGADGNNWSRVYRKNVITINNNDRARKQLGQGLIDGVVGGAIEFATTDAGQAVRDAEQHLRSLFFVHPEAGKRGAYWAMCDEVTTARAGDTIHHRLNPNSSVAAVQTISSNRHYRATIDTYRLSDGGDDRKIDIFYLTAPSRVEVNESEKTEFNSPSKMASQLKASYPSGADRRRVIGTLLFPSHGPQKPAGLARIAGAGYDGVKVDHGGGRLDTFAVSAGGANLSVDGYQFRGRSFLAKKDGSLMTSYLVRKGRSFQFGPRGFASNKEVSLQMTGLSGHINSPGAEVTFKYPGLTRVKINGRVVSPVRTGSSQVTVMVSAGRFRVDFETGTTGGGTTVGSFSQTGDIGAVALAGSARETGSGAFELTASGADIWSGADAFQFASEAVGSANMTIQVRVDGLSNTNGWAKAGVLLRENASAGAKNVAVVVRPDGQVSMQWRASTGGGSAWHGTLVGGTGLPKWVRLVKSGDRYTGFWSTDGSAWQSIREVTVAMGNDLRGGLGATSHNQSQLATARFSKYQLETTAPVVTTTGAFVARDEYKWDFGPAGAPVQPGFEPLTRHMTSGFVRWRNTTAMGDVIHTGGQLNDAFTQSIIWSRASNELLHRVPNGRWEVQVIFGDRYVQENLLVKAEGTVRVSNVDLPERGVVVRRFEVEVSDGELNLEFSDADEPVVWTVCGLRLKKVGEVAADDAVADRFLFDFGTADSPLQPGWIRVTQDTRSGPHRWLDGGVISRDRGAGLPNSDRVRQDLIFGYPRHRFEATVPNGTWRVRVMFGDLRYRHDRFSATANGVAFPEVSTSPDGRPRIEEEREVVVTNGKLTLTFEDKGGTNNAWSVMGVLVRK